MRISANENSPHFHKDYADKCVKVDGVIVANCVEAYEEEGWADVLTADATGFPFRNSDNTVAITRLAGVVCVVDAPQPKPPRRKPKPPPIVLQSHEAMELVEGIVPEIRDPGWSIGDGDILMTFALPDGRQVRYMADIEGDFYGGSYTKIRWEVDPPKAADGG